MFRDDIKYLLSMESLWKKRRPPEPLDWFHLSTEGILLYVLTNIHNLFSLNSHVGSLSLTPAIVHLPPSELPETFRNHH